MQLKSFMQKDRYGNEIAVEFYDVPPMQTPEYDHPGDPKGTDTVPAWLTPGEFVINAEATRKYEPLLTEINNEGRDIQAQQGGSIPTYESDGGFISGLSSLYQGAVDAITMPQAPPGIVYKRLPDGSIGQFTERTGSGGGQKYLGRLADSKPKQGSDFSSFLGIEYKDEGGLTGFLNKYVLGDKTQIGSAIPEKGTVPNYLMGDAKEALLDGLMQVESGGDVNALSEAGAVGPYQIMPSTGAKPGMGVTPISPEDLNNPDEARRFAGDYLTAIARENPDFTQEEVIAAYHSGASNVRKAKEGVEPLGPRGESYPGKVLSSMSPISTAQASTLVPPAESQEPPKEDEPFSIFGFQPFADNRPDSIKENDAAFNKKAAQLNAEEVGESFKEMEIKRLANIEAGRDEFEGINQKTYAGLKDAVKYQQENMIEETEDYAEAAGLSVPEIETMLQQERVRAADIGVPTPEEIEVAKTPEYQDVVRRSAAAGKPPPSPSEFITANTPDETGQSPNDRLTLSKDNPEVKKNEDAVSKAIEKAETKTDTDDQQDAANTTANNVAAETDKEPNPDKDGKKEPEIEQKGNEVPNEQLEAVKGWFTEAFSDLFSGPELARMAIMYAGSRAMGYNHGGSLNYAMKSYVKRVDADVAARQAFITDEDNLEDYTKESLAKYRKTGKVTDLVAKQQGVTMKKPVGNSYLPGVGKVQRFADSDGNEYVEYQGAMTPIANLAGFLEPWDESLHGRAGLQKKFSDQFESSAAALNSQYGLRQGTRNKTSYDDRVVFDSNKLGAEAESRYREILRQNGVSINDAPELQIRVNNAISKYIEDTIKYQQGGKDEGMKKPESIRAYINNETFDVLTGVPQYAVSGTSQTNLNQIDTAIKRDLRDADGKKLGPKDRGYAEAYENAWSATWAAWRLRDKYPDLFEDKKTNWEELAEKKSKRGGDDNQWTAFSLWASRTPASEIQAVIDQARLEGELDKLV